MSADCLRTNFLRACALDVAVRKPGNVSAASPGHGMHAGLFLASAQAAQIGLFAEGASVGARIEAAVAATLAVAGCNTNLGIVLLCVPLAVAFEQAGAAPSEASLRAALRSVLAALDIEDARAAYRAIAAARPGGLGRAEAQDVAAEPTVTLLEAMRLAAPRDRIAWQYANDHADLFDPGLRTLEKLRPTDGIPVGAPAVQALFLGFLGRFPDAHIVRKFGTAQAQAVTAEALPWLQRAAQGELLDADPAFGAWDESLKARGLNPGTSADLTVAALFLAGTLGAVSLPASP